jgi:phosphatidylserine/phosphatidylglycerophosphate/cardiolipin synthase-like enzyme
VIEVRTLDDGGQKAAEVAGWIADFVGAARRTLDLAQYDFHLLPETAAIVGGALHDAHERGVAVRLVYNVDHPNPIPVPPPPEPDVALIASLELPARAIAGVPDLMHHKYAVRDGEAVWTGSMNWTDDSFSHQENVVATLESREIARAFTLDFEHLWESGEVTTGGRAEPRREDVDGMRVRAWFTPGFGEELSQRIASAIGSAKRRVRICSPVITTGPVLGTLAQKITDGRLDVAGCVDQTQVREVVQQWRENGNVSWKLPLLLRVADGHFSGKRSTAWRPEGSLHDFMHAKITVADDRVFLGSFNLSRSGEKNAENVLELRDAELADHLAAYVDDVRGRYPDLELS